MTTGRRNSSTSALRLTMQFARQQFLNGLRVAKLSIAISVFCVPAICTQAQEKEPPRLFRGGLIQQLRSLTEDSPRSSTDEAPANRSTKTHISDNSPTIPKPRPESEIPRGSTPTESRNANLRAAQKSTPKGSAAPTRSPVLNNNSNSKMRATSETYSNSPATIVSKSTGTKSTRPAEMGIPVTNSKLANEARFQLDDKAEGNAEGFSAKSKYDSTKSKNGVSALEDSAKTFNDSLKVQAVESMSQAPKVSRKPLPSGSQPVTKAATKPFEKPQDQSNGAKPSASPVGLKPLGGTYSLEQSNAPETKISDSAPKLAEYPSLQTPSFAAPGATNSKNLSVPIAMTGTPKLPELPTPPASVNNSLQLSPASPKATESNIAGPKRAESKRVDSKPADALAPALLPPNPTGQPNTVGLPNANGLPSSYPALLPNVPGLPAAPGALPPANPAPSASSVRSEPSNELTSVAPRASNPIRTNVESPRADEHMAMETPRLQVLLKGPHDMPVGTPADYQVLVRNVDDIPLDGVILRLEIPSGVTINQGKPSHGELQLEPTPDGATLLTWSFADLAAYQKASAPLQLTAKSPRNFAVAMEWTLLPRTGEAQIEVRQARLELALEGPSEAEYGVANMYRLHVRNPGSAIAKNVNVTLGAASFGASETQIPEILPGAQQSIDVELTFNEKGTISVNAQADAAELHSTASIDVLVKRANVTSAIAGSDRVYHGAPSNYEVRVQNAGDLDSRTVRVELAIPDGTEVLSKPNGASMVSNMLTWEIPSVKAGEELAFPVELNLWTAGEHLLSLATTTENSQPSLSSISTVVEAIADLKLVVNDPVAPAPVGGMVTYELSITNRGSRAATNVRAVAQFSDGIEPVSAEGGPHRLVTGQVIFEPLARIEAGETKLLRVQAKAGAAGTHRFRAEVRSDESELRLVQEETTQYLEGASRIAAPINSSSTIR